MHASRHVMKFALWVVVAAVTGCDAYSNTFRGGFLASAFAPPSGLNPRDSLTKLRATPSKPDSSPTTTRSSVGRLKFCYDRLGKECPGESCLRETPASAIAADLQRAFSDQASTLPPSDTLAEASCIAVLDAYMVAYREARHQKADKPRRQTPEYANAMDAVVDGMQSTLAILNQHDEKYFAEESSTTLRTVDPYATILHMLLELTLDDEQRSILWAQKSLEVLRSLESNLVLATAEHAGPRLVQYNKVLKGLASSKETLGEAVALLEILCGIRNPTEVVAGPKNGSAVATALEQLVIGPGIVPDAKSFATVLGSPLLEEGDARSLLRASVACGVYQGYLEKFATRRFGESRLSELLGDRSGTK